MRHILSLSGGKDSTYLLYLLIKNNLPLDEVVCAILPFEEPEMVKHLQNLDNYLFIKKKFNITFIENNKSIEQFMAEKTKKGKHKGIIRGFPLKGAGFCWISRDWKIRPLQKYLKTRGQHILYLGFAIDEKNQNRQSKIKEYINDPIKYFHKNMVSYPLVDFKLTESDCLDGLKECGLINRVHLLSNRSGCWFCQKSRKKERIKAINRFPERIKLIKRFCDISKREIYPDLNYSEIIELKKEVRTMKQIDEDTIKRLLQNNHTLIRQMAIDMNALKHTLTEVGPTKFQNTVYRDLSDRWTMISEQGKEIERIMNNQVLSQAE